MARLLSAIIFLLILLPIWFARRVTGASRFGRHLHRAPSAWDRSIEAARVPGRQVRPAVQGS